MRWIKRIALAAVVIAGTAPAAAAEAAPPANDTYANAVVIVANPFGDTVDLTDATTDADDAEVAAACNADAASISHTVWYAITPAVDRTIAISTDPTVAGAVVTGSPGSFASVPGGCFFGGTAVHLTAGTTYHIALAVFGDNTPGVTRIIVADAELPEISLTVDPSGGFTRAGEAVITGTATCTGGGFLSLNVTQPVGRISTVQAGLGTGLICDGTSRPWSATAMPYTGLFRGGKATVNAFGNVCNVNGCNYAQVTQSVLLKGR